MGVFISIEQLIELLFLFQHPKKAQKDRKLTTICWIGPFRSDGQKPPKAALRAKIARDGEWRDTSGFTNEKRMKGGETMRQKALAAHSVLLTDRIQALREKGLGYAKIANELNRIGERTRQGKEYKSMTVKRIIDRMKAQPVA